MRNIILISIFSITFLGSSRAGCLDGFKKIIRTHLERKNSEKIEKIIFNQRKKRVSPFNRDVFLIVRGARSKIYFRSTKRLLEFIGEKNIPEQLKVNQEISKTLWRSLNEGSEVIEWVKVFQRELYIDAYYNSPFKQKFMLKIDGMISRSTILRVMEKKYIDTKMFESFQTIDRTLTEESFGYLLLTRKLIIDKTFAGKAHGELIHLLQVDMMFYILRKNGFTNKEIIDFYSWMGRSQRIHYADRNTAITPIGDVWATLFDSFEKNLGRPETFNPMLMKVFGLR
jgi:hypothetical protein